MPTSRNPGRRTMYAASAPASAGACTGERRTPRCPSTRRVPRGVELEADADLLAAAGRQHGVDEVELLRRVDHERDAASRARGRWRAGGCRRAPPSGSRPRRRRPSRRARAPRRACTRARRGSRACASRASSTPRTRTDFQATRIGVPSGAVEHVDALWRARRGGARRRARRGARWRRSSAGQYRAGSSQVGGIRRRHPSRSSSAGRVRHQRTLRTRATASAPAKANTAPSTKTSTNEPGSDDRGRAEQRARPPAARRRRCS